MKERLSPTTWFLIAAASMVLALVLGNASMAQAQEALEIRGEGTTEIRWQLPTRTTSGAVIAPGQLTGTVIYWDMQSRYAAGGPPALRSGCTTKPITTTDVLCYGNFLRVPDGTTTTTDITIFLEEDSSIYFAAVSEAAGGTWSAYSNEIRKQIALEIIYEEPEPPVMESVDMTITCTTNLPSVTCRFTVE